MAHQPNETRIGSDRTRIQRFEQNESALTGLASATSRQNLHRHMMAVAASASSKPREVIRHRRVGPRRLKRRFNRRSAVAFTKPRRDPPRVVVRNIDWQP